MSTKTITLSQDAYDLLARRKEGKESFSDVVRRLSTGVKLSDFAGILTKEEGRIVRERVEKMRAYSSSQIKTVRDR